MRLLTESNRRSHFVGHMETWIAQQAAASALLDLSDERVAREPNVQISALLHLFRGSSRAIHRKSDRVIIVLGLIQSYVNLY